MIFLIFILSFSQLIDIKRNSKSDSELIINIAKTQIGIPYQGGTLDTGFIESCVVNYKGLDCVTFVENTLAIANALNNPRISEGNFEQLIIKNVENTRYRDGKLVDYISRLHYTGDWIKDNVNRNIFIDITKELGGELLNQNVNFMSSNPIYYKQLENNIENIKRIIEIEKEINNYLLYYIPKNKISYKGIESGDIICIATNIKGLDYSHLGFGIKEGNKLKLIHASSTKKKVVTEEDLKAYLNSVKNHKGITVLRPFFQR
jgi:hypothetical protein